MIKELKEFDFLKKELNKVMEIDENELIDYKSEYKLDVKIHFLYDK